MCTSPGVPVLNYHQVEDKDGNPLTLYCDQFDQQMAYLAEEGYHTITLDEMMDAAENGTPLPEKPVVITLDDGYVDNYEYAYPILKKWIQGDDLSHQRFHGRLPELSDMGTDSRDAGFRTDRL